MSLTLGALTLIVSASNATPDRTWLGWLSGFLAIGVVLAILVGAVHLIRRRRSDD